MHNTAVVHEKHYIQVNWIHRIAALLCFKILSDQNFSIWKMYKKKKQKCKPWSCLAFTIEVTQFGYFEWIAAIIVLGIEEKAPENKEVFAKREESQPGWQEEKTALQMKGKTAWVLGYFTEIRETIIFIT